MFPLRSPLLGAAVLVPPAWINPATNYTFNALNNIATWANTSGSVPKHVVTTTSKNAGKWYAEVVFVVGAAGEIEVGFVEPGYLSTGYVGTNDGHSWGWWPEAAFGVYFNASPTGNGSITGANGDVVGLAIDASTGKMWWAKNNTWFNSGNPGAGTNAFFTGTGGNSFSVSATFNAVGAGTQTVTINRTPTYAPPSGFTYWTG